ncbi:hypothetical protein IWQ60_012417 [Tieghemiomyces parasiticus]|uniref:Uncharacterized protein n=1 Tax=Tieghemiomyces parasiticus TaxID=78921 RepID=A0A9W8DLD9_9FUNG|nr:hypothetical protein IWQ60_012417 [Tieghemiomyces parasiticus]
MKCATAVLFLAVASATVLANTDDLNSIMDCMQKPSCSADPVACGQTCLGISKADAEGMMSCETACPVPSDASSNSIENYTKCVTGCISQYSPKLSSAMNGVMTSLNAQLASATSELDSVLASSTNDADDTSSASNSAVVSSAMVAITGAIALYRL